MIAKSTPRSAYLLAALALASLFGAPDIAEAQSASARVRAMNREAMEHYHNLEFEEAERILNEARALAERRRVRGAALANVYLNLGVVMIGAHSDNGRGLEFFRRAIEADAEVALDPMLATPDMERMFALARRQAARGAPDGEPTVLAHTPANEQLIHTPLPVYAAAADVDAVAGKLFYRSGAAGAFAEVPMERVADGFGAQIPCDAMLADSVSYYVELYGGTGAVVAVVGSADAPVRVSIVSARMGTAPSLPGMAPPAQCPGELACEEGEACEGTPGVGAACEDDSECAHGLYCVDGGCYESMDGPEASPSDRSRAFIRWGIGLGAGLVRPGLPADRPVEFHPVDQATDWDPNGTLGPYAPSFLGELAPGTFTPQAVEALNLEYIQTYWSGYTENPNNNYEFGAVSARNGASSGVLNPDPDCDAPQGEYCVRVTDPGFAQTYSVNLGAGYWITDRLALGVHMRMALMAGRGTLARFLLSTRAEYSLTQPAAEGFYANASLRVGIGRIQLKVDQGRIGVSADLASALPNNSTEISVADPWANTGMGSAMLSFPTGYRISRSFGVVATPTMYVMFPDTSVVLDVVLGVDVGF